MITKRLPKKLLRELVIEQKADHDGTIWVDKDKKQVFVPKLRG